MATTVAHNGMAIGQAFPVDILRSLLPMIIGGLHSTQIWIRQSTYRFLVSHGIIGAMRRLPEEDIVALLEAIKYARDRFEADVCDKYGRNVVQVNDFGTILNHFVESGQLHPTTLKPLIPIGNGDIEWVWRGPAGEDLRLGQKEVDTKENKSNIGALLKERVSRLWIQLMSRQPEKPSG